MTIQINSQTRAAYTKLLMRYFGLPQTYGIECFNGVDYSGAAWKTKTKLYAFDRQDILCTGNVKDFLTVTPLQTQ